MLPKRPGFTRIQDRAREDLCRSWPDPSIIFLFRFQQNRMAMRLVFPATISLFLALMLSERNALAQDWGWRGPTGNGIAADGQSVPAEWSAEKNVLWSADVPGRGHSSPVIGAGKIFLTTADEVNQTQSAVCYDQATGKQLWNTQLHSGGFVRRIDRNNTQASPTVAFGDDHVFAVFCTNDAVQVNCLDLEGNPVWHEEIGPWVPSRYQFGFGQSPIFYDGKLIVTSESEADPFVMALDPKNGKRVWKIERPKWTSYATPVVAEIAGKKQLLISGGQFVASYDPSSGKELWSTGASWGVVCGTMVWNQTNGLVYSSGGFPTQQTVAVKADGSGQTVWENRVKCYEQSLIAVDGCVYGFAEGGILYCWDAANGEQLWVQRLEGGESASPVFADGKLFVTNEQGKTWVLRPNRQKFDLIATNQLGDEMFASMAVVGNRIFMRIADKSTGKRMERLYCIGTNPDGKPADEPKTPGN